MISELIHAIKTRQHELSNSLALGNAGSWESYQKMVGEYQAYQSVLDLIDSKLEEQNSQE